MNNEEVILLKDALKIFSEKESSGMYKPFLLVYRTYNKTTKKGGKLKTEISAKYLPNAKEETVTVKNPNHYKNRTRNIELPSGEIRTINIDFIISINNKKVIY